MPRTLTRPTQVDISTISDALITSDLSPRSRRHLRAVLAWAGGKTVRQVAADASLKMSGFTARQAIHRYRAGGLAAFLNAGPLANDRRRRITAEQVNGVLDDLRQALARGESISYRTIKARRNLSLWKISQIANKHGLDPAHRRGPMPPKVG